MKIAITGTPGTGKTTIAKKLADTTDLKYVSINELAKENDCISGRDDERAADIIDIGCLTKIVDEMDNCILDGHVSHLFDVTKVIVLRTEPNVLKQRLKKKGWPDDKINENCEAEYIGIIAVEARNKNNTVLDINTTHAGPDEITNTLTKLCFDADIKKFEQIDWIEKDVKFT